MPEKRVIICLGNSETPLAESAGHLKAKWSTKSGRVEEGCRIIHLDSEHPTRVLRSVLNTVDDDSNILIIGHGKPTDNNALYFDNKASMSLNQVARVVKGLTDTDITGKPDHPLNISLIACYGGYKTNASSPSIAENLHRELHDQGLATEMTTRSTVVTVNMWGRKSTFTDEATAELVALHQQLDALKPDQLLERIQLERRIQRIEDREPTEYDHSKKIRLTSSTESKDDDYELKSERLAPKAHSSAHSRRAHIACDQLDTIKRGYEERTGKSLSPLEMSVFDKIKREIMTRGHENFTDIISIVNALQILPAEPTMLGSIPRTADRFPALFEIASEAKTALIALQHEANEAEGSTPRPSS